MSNGSVRGAGKARAGATDTTMLIWKTIAANPGITRQGIWERVEHDIPAGYARRLYANWRRKSIGPNDSSPILSRARRHVLTDVLCQMRKLGTVSWEGDGKERRYTVAREPTYRGNPDAIDETGSKAAEHMVLAEALRTAEKWLARAQPDRPVGRSGRNGPVLGPPSRKEYEALLLVVKALRKT